MLSAVGYSNWLLSNAGIGQNERMKLPFSHRKSRLPYRQKSPASHCMFITIKVVALRIFAFFVAMLLILKINAFSQEIRIDTKLAVFEATVTDKNGIPVTGLTADDFSVLEDGVERKIEFFAPVKDSNNSRPLIVVFALDISGSMTEEEITRLRSAVDNFMKKVGDENSLYAVVTFAMRVRLLQDFTPDRSKITASLGKLGRDKYGLSTHLYDAVDYSIRLIKNKTPRSMKNTAPKRAIVVVTDGFPVGDTVSPQTVIERANNEQVSVYSIILPSYSRIESFGKRVPTPLEAAGLTVKTGGLDYPLADEELNNLFERLADEVTSSYAIAFYPGEGKGPGEVRKVKIIAKRGFTIRQNREQYTITSLPQ